MREYINKLDGVNGWLIIRVKKILKESLENKVSY